MSELIQTSGIAPVVAQTQIQSQIILLQGSVIKLLQEALLTGTIPDINRLYNTSEFARDGSVRALRDQYQRLLESAPLQRRPVGPVRRTSSTPSLQCKSTTSASSDRQRPQNTLTNNDDTPLFCSGARELQHPSRPLESVISIDHSSAVCVACGSGFGVGEEVDSCRPWRIEKEVAVRRRIPARDDRRFSGDGDDASEAIVVRQYLLSRRFILKCHRRGSGYACYLCFRYRDRDTLCNSEESLVSHVTSKHSVREYAGDPDIREQNRTLPLR